MHERDRTERRVKLVATNRHDGRSRSITLVNTTAEEVIEGFRQFLRGRTEKRSKASK